MNPSSIILIAALLGQSTEIDGNRGPTFSPECDRSCMRSCSKEEIGKAQKCETLDDLKENGCLASCPCVYETIAKWMKCGVLDKHGCKTIGVNKEEMTMTTFDKNTVYIPITDIVGLNLKFPKTISDNGTTYSTDTGNAVLTGHRAVKAKVASGTKAVLLYLTKQEKDKWSNLLYLTACKDEDMLIPRCDDGIQSGSESGVDCGGIHCVSCEYKELVEKIQDSLCIDDITYTNAKGETCADDFYENSPQDCEKYDTKNFRAKDMCCACGGGRTYELKEAVQMKRFMEAVIDL